MIKDRIVLIYRKAWRFLTKKRKLPVTLNINISLFKRKSKGFDEWYYRQKVNKMERENKWLKMQIEMLEMDISLMEERYESSHPWL